ncbi:hypothetical protein OIU77_028367 [Salix suchowensis]|uniref:Uncharacterized protein n=1 Tax=Salix suchowensis TaxID=1278906 RepID=A0ABQ9BKZ4_9ROSI|nr:hypothetical protein OIU77_028367 [Salix suchowensis]
MSPTLLWNGVALRMEEKAIWRALATSLEIKSKQIKDQSVKLSRSSLHNQSCLACQLLMNSFEVCRVCLVSVSWWLVVVEMDGGQGVIMIVMYAYVVFVVMFYKDDDFKPAGLGFTALYAYVIRYLCSVYLFFPSYFLFCHICLQNS